MDDEYDRSGGGFQNTLGRNRLFSLSTAIVFISTHFVMDVGKAANLDVTLYARPLSDLAWKVF